LSSPLPPRDLKDWNIEVLNKLVKLRDIEGDRFDFKGGDLGDLANHICAMANANEGIMVMGIDEKKNGEYLVEFEKKGYPSGKEDSIKKQITDFIVQVDPPPKVTVESISDKEGRFYPLMKIEGDERYKPYMLKNKGTIYVRINSSTVPASRITILNLFGNVRERLKDVRTLRTTCEATKNAYILTAQIIGHGNTSSWATIPPLDLTFLKAASMQAQWFLVEKGIYGEVELKGYKSGMQTHLHSLEKMNAYIETFNRAGSPHDKGTIILELDTWQAQTAEFDKITGFLNRVIEESDKYIKVWNV
jgi:hypothetical protein